MRKPDGRSRAAVIAWAAVGLGLVTLVWAAVASRSDPEREIDEARSAMIAGRPERAAAALDRLARARPPTEADRLMRADVERVLNRPDRALEELRAIGDDAPESPLARSIEGQIEVRRGRLRPAEAALRRALGLDPGLVTARRELIFILGQQMRRRELVAQIEALGRQEPLTYDEVWLWCAAPDVLGWVPEESVVVLEGFLAADPEDRWSRLALADQYRRAARYDEAESTLAALSDSDPAARVVHARVALDLGDVEAADRLLAGSSADDPDLARIRGRLDLARRDYPAALRAFRAAEAADPGHRETIHGLGQALRLIGDDAGAAPRLDEAARLDELGALLERAGTTAGRADPDSPRRLGAACEALERRPQARAWYRLAIRRDPLDAEAQHALYRLERGAGAPTR